MSYQSKMKLDLVRPYRESGSTITHWGKVNKFVRYAQTVHLDRKFLYYIRQRGYMKTPINTWKYGMALGNWDAGKKAFLKYDWQEPVYDELLLSKAAQMLMQSYAIVPKSGLTVDYTAMFEKTTSAGYPWSLIHKNKSTAMQDPVVMDYVHRYVHANEYVPSIASNTCKREPKKNEKLINNDLRTIMALPMEMTAKGNFLFGDMNNNIAHVSRKGLLSSWLGCSKFNQGWHKLYHRLRRLPLAMEMDFSSFDRSIDSRTLDIIMNLRLNLFHASLLTPDLLSSVRAYYTNIKHTLVVLENGSLCMKHTGNPSGQTNTITDNSMANELRWLYAWVSLVPPEMHTIKHFKSYVELVVVGDDSVLTVDPIVRDCFNPSNILPLFEKMGWGAKFASDTFMNLDDVQFCSLKFHHYGKWVVPIPASGEKILTSMILNGGKNSVRSTLQRALSIRMDVFYDENLFTLFDGFCFSLMAAEAQRLQVDPPEGEPSWGEFLAMSKSQAELSGMYLNPSVAEG